MDGKYADVRRSRYENGKVVEFAHSHSIAFDFDVTQSMLCVGIPTLIDALSTLWARQ